MRTRFALAAIAAACLSTIAAAQMGPGMNHPGMGPGAMGGQGMGPGMMGGQDGAPMGQAMMRGHGMGRGMHGMDAGMMGGAGFAAIDRLNLNDEQRGKVREIRRDLQRKQYALMGGAREIRWKAQDAAKAPELDVAAARKLYDEGAVIRKQMFEARLEARAKAEAVLTKEQREELRKAVPRAAGPGPR